MLCLIQRFLAPTPKLVIGKQDPTEGNTSGEQVNIHEEHFQHSFLTFFLYGQCSPCVLDFKS
ncbi:protein of unknown function [Pseudomonas sp. JV551A1]|uniref:Uncharacterized protein n=1 Tax=Pseudomonas inefficax TaxID=2078786 RepID=A0AAQ1PDI7_9PSED|nr:protein of unknown function [Pseudomonas sp. JV551A1]SPO63729.1 protein of unknown function [Pseudomonas inefficax]